MLQSQYFVTWFVLWIKNFWFYSKCQTNLMGRIAGCVYNHEYTQRKMEISDNMN